ncbi:MAG: hypothetical protein J7513_09335 [Solirubrobacteraceae bacterium]|nr:hypothetical protein [Solirubrobacteraceae bacterium]
MIPTESHELAELVADLTVVIDVVAPPHPPAAIEAGGTVGPALASFAAAWCPLAGARTAAIADQAVRIAAAGMALVEGDPVTARRLIASEPTPTTTA